MIRILRTPICPTVGNRVTVHVILSISAPLLYVFYLKGQRHEILSIVFNNSNQTQLNPRFKGYLKGLRLKVWRFNYRCLSYLKIITRLCGDIDTLESDSTLSFPLRFLILYRVESEQFFPHDLWQFLMGLSDKNKYAVSLTTPVINSIKHRLKI